MTNPATMLRRGFQLRLRAAAAQDEFRVLRSLGRATMRSAAEVRRLHELACFLRAYPHDKATLRTADHILLNFARRPDLLRHRHDLANSGIAGTAIHYSFYWQTAKWIEDTWPNALSVDWDEFEKQDGLDELWPLLLSQPAAEALEHLAISPHTWVRALKRPKETDAAFLIRRFRQWRVSEPVRQKTWEDLDIPLILSHVQDGPSRTVCIYRRQRVFFQSQQRETNEPLSAQVRQLPKSVHYPGPKQGKRLIDLARTQMITRNRDLFVFMHADPRDVRVLSYNHGLQFICYGLQPDQRCLLETMYAFVILKNGVPIGYTQATALLRSAEINFNIFDGFRGAETASVFNTVLAMVRHLFKADTFIVNTHQLGEGNPEALRSGAFWFYYKQGFRPLDLEVERIARTELSQRRAQPGHRSNLATLRRLAASDLYFCLSRPRRCTVSTFPTGAIGFAAACALEQRANNSDHAIDLATRLLGYRTRTDPSPAQRTAWENWSAIVLALSGLERWSTTNKKALIAVINAKGGRRESDFVGLFDKHRALQNALLRLADKQAP